MVSFTEAKKARNLANLQDSRLDLFNRRLKEQSARLRSRAVELIPKGLRTPKVGATYFGDERDGYREVEGEVGGEDGEARRRGRYKQDVEREVDRIKVKVSSRCASLQWLKLTR